MRAERNGLPDRVLRLSPASALRWLAAVALVTAALWWFRNQLDKAHVALTFLLVVLSGSARHGRRLGVALAVVCFLCFNFFLLPPYYTLVLADPLDWVVLLAFLATGLIAAHLLDRAQTEAASALQRAEEIDRLSILGAETLNVARAEEAVVAIARVLQSTLRVAACDIHGVDAATGALYRIALASTRDAKSAVGTDALFEYVIEHGALAAQRLDGTLHVTGRNAGPLAEGVAALGEAHVIVMPLEVRGGAVGVLRLSDPSGINLDLAQARFAAVLAYYAALGVERVRLVAEEERADALRRADRLKDAFLASVSHDLRTPLTTIKALAHELAVDGSQPALVIEEEADRLNRLVADLLDLSSIAANALPVHREIVAAEDVVGAALQQIGGLHRERNISVSLPPGGEIAVGLFDFRHTLRILVNLLDNALKYSAVDEPVELRIGRDDENLTFEVLDRGRGIPAADVERVFEPFFRSHDAASRSGGTGLGLAIARQLAEAQGGSVVYEPREAGGCIFTLCLPSAEMPQLADTSS